MLDIYQLQQLIAVAENETLMTAAESLYLSHSTLSRSMKKMEKELGVELFTRTKNKMSLNENGKVAVEEAKKVLAQLELLEKHVRDCDMNRHTISVGVCAPGALWELLPLLTSYFPNRPILTEVNDVDFLTEQLLTGKYQLIVIARKLEDDRICCKRWTEEQLFFSVNQKHPKANAQQLSFREIEEETILLFSDIGCWKHVCERNLPNAHFIVQQNRSDFIKLAETSFLPVFKTNLSQRYYSATDGRISVPIVDQEAVATYYCCCLEHNQDQFQGLFDLMDTRDDSISGHDL